MVTMPTPFGSIEGTGWLANGNPPSAVPPAGGRPGDYYVVAVERDRTAGTAANLTAPSGYTHAYRSGDYISGNQRLDVFYKRLLTYSELTNGPTLNWPHDADYSLWKGFVRGVSLVQSGKGQAATSQINWPSVTLATPGACLLFMGGDANSVPYGSGAPPGMSRIAVNPTIQWEANLNVFFQNDMAAGATGTLGDSASWGAKCLAACIGFCVEPWGLGGMVMG